MGLPNSMRILYETSLLTEAHEQLMHRSIVFPFFSSIWRTPNMWSVVDLLCRNPHWWPPIISSAYVINLDSKMSDNILNVVDKTDVGRVVQSV